MYRPERTRIAFPHKATHRLSSPSFVSTGTGLKPQASHRLILFSFFFSPNRSIYHKGWDKSRFTVVSMGNQSLFFLFIYYCILFIWTMVNLLLPHPVFSKYTNLKYTAYWSFTKVHTHAISYLDQNIEHFKSLRRFLGVSSSRPSGLKCYSGMYHHRFMLSASELPRNGITRYVVIVSHLYFHCVSTTPNPITLCHQHNALYRTRVTEMYIWNLCDLNNQCHPNQFKLKNK